MQNEYVVAALQLFTIILIVGICTARIVQLRSELKEFKGWSWRKPGDNRKRLLMLLFWPVGSMICTGLLCGLLNSIYLISLTAQFEHIVYYVAPYYMYMIIPMGCSFYGLIEHMVVRNKMGDQALDLLFWAGEPPVRTSAALLDDFRNYPVTEPYIERVRAWICCKKAA